MMVRTKIKGQVKIKETGSGKKRRNAKKRGHEKPETGVKTRPDYPHGSAKDKSR